MIRKLEKLKDGLDEIIQSKKVPVKYRKAAARDRAKLEKDLNVIYAKHHALNVYEEKVLAKYSKWETY